MTASKIVLNAASGVGGAGLDVDEVFSTYLYTGNSGSQTITNGIDLSGEGGLVWLKGRAFASNHHLIDTERGSNKFLISNSNGAEQTSPSGADVTSFNSNGFSFGTYYNNINFNNYTYASWTFRKAEKFFDVVTYTGNGASSRSISHNLGSIPGMIIIKQTSGGGENWIVWHRSISNVSNGEIIYLNATDSESDMNGKFDGANLPTSTTFTIEQDNSVNASNASYVAYLFAHNNNDGEFGPDADQDIIKCGNYTGNGSGTGPTVNLGFEPQWLLIKNASASGNWTLFDSMRGLGVPTLNTGYKDLNPNLTNAEAEGRALGVTATGFQIVDDHAEINGSGNNYIYIAIRRGTAVPESATEVFAVAPRTNTIPGFASGFPVDFLIGARTINGLDNNEIKTRLVSRSYLRANTTGAETVSDQTANFAHNDGFFNFSGANANQYCWMWKRSIGYMDCVAYSGNSTAGRTVSHNLGGAPEMMWVRPRSFADHWNVYHTANGNTKYMRLNTDDTPFTNTNIWNSTTPDASSFTLGSDFGVNGSGYPYIAYLFATLAGISKVGSATHSGTTNVDCGFTSGARFVLLKRTDASGDWYFWDSVRGIVSGNDPYLLLNSTAVQVTNTDLIDPLSSGFTITSNFTAGDYIFYAIA